MFFRLGLLFSLFLILSGVLAFPENPPLRFRVWYLNLEFTDSYKLQVGAKDYTLDKKDDISFPKVNFPIYSLVSRDVVFYSAWFGKVNGKKVLVFLGLAVPKGQLCIGELKGTQLKRQEEIHITPEKCQLLGIRKYDFGGEFLLVPINSSSGLIYINDFEEEKYYSFVIDFDSGEVQPLGAQGLGWVFGTVKGRLVGLAGVPFRNPDSYLWLYKKGELRNFTKVLQIPFPIPASSVVGFALAPAGDDKVLLYTLGRDNKGYFSLCDLRFSPEDGNPVIENPLSLGDVYMEFDNDTLLRFFPLGNGYFVLIDRYLTTGHMKLIRLVRGGDKVSLKVIGDPYDAERGDYPITYIERL